MNRFYIATGGVAGILGVSLGAFGAHGLKGILSPEMMEIFRTAVLYHLLHAVAIIALSANSIKFNSASTFFLTGIILFSFSLYLYAVTGIKIFALITPLGGISFLVGWGLVVMVGVRKN